MIRVIKPAGFGNIQLEEVPVPQINPVSNAMRQLTFDRAFKSNPTWHLLVPTPTP